MTSVGLRGGEVDMRTTLRAKAVSSAYPSPYSLQDHPPNPNVHTITYYYDIHIYYILALY